eukprot:4268733-Lingulodinium_polyedra.AAC.1
MAQPSFPQSRWLDCHKSGGDLKGGCVTCQGRAAEPGPLAMKTPVLGTAPEPPRCRRAPRWVEPRAIGCPSARRRPGLAQGRRRLPPGPA